MWPAIIGAVGSLGAGALNLFGQRQQQGNNEQALQMAMLNYQLQKQQMERQYELATAGQEDARGNRTRYVPGQGWVVDTTPQTDSMISGSDAVQRQGMTESLGRGRLERGQAFDRRQQEGVAASPLLQQFINKYGAPNRDAVVGANNVANVTEASEGADAIRGGFTSAALRTGSGGVPLQQSLASLDRGATGGIRSALARGDAEGGPLFQQILDQWTAGKLNPYNTLATRASNVENMPFSPESLSGNLDAVGLNRAGSASRFGASAQPNVTPLLAAMASQRQPNYDTFAAGITANLKNLPWDDWFGTSSSGPSPAARYGAPTGASRIF